MIDWTRPMYQSFEYYKVDPGTWSDMEQITSITSCTIDYDISSNTIVSANVESYGALGEWYVRVYLVADQRGEIIKEPLGTFFLQTPNDNYDGSNHKVSYDGYGPLIELNWSYPPMGYYVEKYTDIIRTVMDLTDDNSRAIVYESDLFEYIGYDFVCDPSESWLTYLSGLLNEVGYSYSTYGDGIISIVSIEDIFSNSIAWVYTDDNSSIIYPEVTIDGDLFSVPNVVEIVYTQNEKYFFSRAVNDNKNSPISVVNRGYELVHRITDPSLYGTVTQHDVDEYAKTVLEEVSTIEYTLTYSHAYNGVRINDYVIIDYQAAGLTNIQAKVVAQSISCQASCPVQETVKYKRNYLQDNIFL